MSEQRTPTQNSALWVYYTLLAEQLNLAGLDMKKVLKPGVDIPWTKNSVHDHLWIPIQNAMESNDSTTELTTVTIQDVYLVLSRHISEKFGINVEWPSNR